MSENGIFIEKVVNKRSLRDFIEFHGMFIATQIIGYHL